MKSSCIITTDSKLKSKRKGRTEKGGLLQENWLEYRVREPDLLENTLSDHLKKLRKDIANLCEKSSVREGIEELQNYSVWLYNLELQVNDFLSQASPGYVYWVEREFSESSHHRADRHRR